MYTFAKIHQIISQIIQKWVHFVYKLMHSIFKIFLEMADLYHGKWITVFPLLYTLKETK